MTAAEERAFDGERCFLGTNAGQRDGAAFNLPSGGVIKTNANTALYTFSDMVRNKLREAATGACYSRSRSGSGSGSACAGTLVYKPECTAVDAQLNFNPSDHVAALITSVRAALFGSPSAPFHVVHLRRGDRCGAFQWFGDDVRCGPVETQPFLPMCQDPSLPPVYVATDDFSLRTHAVLRWHGCKTFNRDVPDLGDLQDWEVAAVDQFLMAEAAKHFTMDAAPRTRWRARRVGSEG